MKKYFYLLTLCSFFGFSQNANDKKVFLDSLFRETAEGNHKYYRITKDYYFAQESYKTNTYYASGILQMEGTFKDNEAYLKNGEFIYYYENGNKKTQVTYQKNKSIGAYFDWYENGDKKTEGEYILNEKKAQSDLKIINFWDSKKNLIVEKGQGFYDSSEEKLSIKGKIINGFKEGVWTGYDGVVKANFTENYTDGKLISGKSFDIKTKTEYSYEAVESQPEPAKGIDHFNKFLAKKMKIPNFNHPIKGRILLEFIVEKDGKISNINVLRSLQPDFDNAGIAVLKKYKRWKAGQVRGIPSRFRYALPLAIDAKMD